MRIELLVGLFVLILLVSGCNNSNCPLGGADRYEVFKCLCKERNMEIYETSIVQYNTFSCLDESGGIHKVYFNWDKVKEINFRTCEIERESVVEDMLYE